MPLGVQRRPRNDRRCFRIRRCEECSTRSMRGWLNSGCRTQSRRRQLKRNRSNTLPQGNPRQGANTVAEIDLSTLMQKAQELQTRMKEMQETASSLTVEAQSGGGMVRVVVDGTLRLRKIEIDAAIVAANDKSMLEDLILVAVNDGMARAQKMLAEEMSKLGPLGGLQIPGFGS